MYSRILVLVVGLLAINNNLEAQRKTPLNGMVIDSSSGKGLGGVNVLVTRNFEYTDTVVAGYTNEKGVFKLAVPDSLVEYQVFFSRQGYTTAFLRIYPELGAYEFTLPLSRGGARPSGNTAIKFRGNKSKVREAAYRAGDAIAEFQRGIVNKLVEHAKSGAGRETFPGISLEQELAKISAGLESTKDLQMKKVLLAQYVGTASSGQKIMVRKKETGTIDNDNSLLIGKPDPRILEQALHYLSPHSGLWSMEPEAIRWLLKQVPLTGKTLDYLERMISGHGSPAVAAAALYGLVQRYHAEGRTTEYAETFTRLLSDFPFAAAANKAKKEFAEYASLKTGSAVPRFSIPSLLQTGGKIDSAALAGKPYLLEFWGLGCRGCILAIPGLQELYKKYKAAGFEIVSVSLDNNPELVRKFIATKFEMPWLHGIETAGFRSELAKQFELSWIPRSLLVDKNGKIVAVDPFPDQLEKQVAGLLK